MASVSSSADAAVGGILSLSLNASRDQLAACTNTGLFIFALEPSLRLVERIDFGSSGVGCVSQLNQTNIVALCGGGSSPWRGYVSKVALFDMRTHTVVVTVDVQETVRSVVLTDVFLAASTNSHVYIFDLTRDAAIRLLPTPRSNYPSQARGVALAASIDRTHPAVAFPGPERGRIYIVSPSRSGSAPVVIQTAAEEDVACLALSHSADMVAVSYTTGTVVEVYSVESGMKVKEFRRGSTTARIFSLAFSRAGDKLAAVSSHGSLHVFLLSAPPAPAAAADSAPAQGGGFWSGLSTAVSRVSAVGTQVSALGKTAFEYARAYAPASLTSATTTASDATSGPPVAGAVVSEPAAAAAASPARSPPPPATQTTPPRGPTPPSPRVDNQRSRLGFLGAVIPWFGSQWSAWHHTLPGSPDVPRLVSFAYAGTEETVVVASLDGAYLRYRLGDAGGVFLQDDGTKQFSRALATSRQP